MLTSLTRFTDYNQAEDSGFFQDAEALQEYLNTLGPKCEDFQDH